MFSYFGSKTSIANLYPPPRFPVIIEPFAGAAKYALHYPLWDVWLNDYDAMLANCWRWIINITQEEIDTLPQLSPGENINQWCRERGRYLSGAARWFVTRNMGRGRVSGAVTYGGWAAEDAALETAYKRLRRFQGRLTHWKITDMDYRKLPDIEACWFIDAPYKVQGHNYSHHDLDYEELGSWCRSRKGLCEKEINSDIHWQNFFKKFSENSEYREQIAGRSKEDR